MTKECKYDQSRDFAPLSKGACTSAREACVREACDRRYRGVGGRP